MERTAIGGGGAVCVLLLAAVAGAAAGYARGAEFVGRAGVEPGAGAAALGAVVAIAYGGWFALPAGLAIGAAAGFGSWVVRRRDREARPAAAGPPPA